MPKYIAKQSLNFSHPTPKRPQDSPHAAPDIKYVDALQEPAPDDNSPFLPKTRKEKIEKVVGALLFYGHDIDLTILVALSTIVSQQNQLTEKIEQAINQLLGCLTSHPNETIQYYASEMILQIHSDASYLSEKNSRS